jgi:hypothetical protein
VNPARTPRVAPPLAHVLHAPLMDGEPSTVARDCLGGSTHEVRTLDLGLLHHTLLL